MAAHPKLCNSAPDCYEAETSLDHNGTSIPEKGISHGTEPQSCCAEGWWEQSLPGVSEQSPVLGNYMQTPALQRALGLALGSGIQDAHCCS